MSSPVVPRPLTVEQGRKLVASARRFQIWERVGLGVSAGGILTFGVSIIELRAIDTATMAGGPSRIPYLAYAGIFLFWAGFALLWYMRSRVLHIHRMLDVEQKRRDAEAVAAQLGEEGPSDGTEGAADVAGAAEAGRIETTTPAEAGRTDTADPAHAG